MPSESLNLKDYLTLPSEAFTNVESFLPAFKRLKPHHSNLALEDARETQGSKLSM